MDITAYAPEHLDDVRRQWLETGWIDHGNDQHAEAQRTWLSMGNGSVALIDGHAEAFGHWTPGAIWYVDRPVSLAAVTAITTSRVARRQGMATALTARALLEGKDAGHTVAGLGIFDQGFYDRFGFGTASYEHRFSFDPASLKVEVSGSIPVRLSVDDYEEIHALLLRRHRSHGAVTLDPPELVKAELLWTESPFGLGFRAKDGRLTHFVYGMGKGESGPYTVQWLAYEEPSQFRELLSLIRGLSDQVASVVMWEPPGIQLQDFIDRPFRQRVRTTKSDHETSHRAAAFTQLRILDLEAAMAARSWMGPEVRFNLSLRDPIDAIEPAVSIAGDYVVTIGAESGVEVGTDSEAPTLQASVNALTRLWIGVRDASTLAVSDDLDGSPELLARLDAAFGIPEPRQGWMY
ncbi:MAG: GNAT family N-acetyltransferase [Acidimicrobiia bacterium]|nr:GNAT family N-acetyltransferase [Acidimicrobiia bacterium]